jgi:hypothetical protein
MTTYDLTLADGVQGAETASTNITADCDFSDELELTDLVEAVKTILDTLTDTVTFTATAVAEYAGDLSASDTVHFTDSTETLTTILIALSEEVVFTELVTPNAILNAILNDGLTVVAIVTVEGEEYVVWVANADTFAHSQYAHFNFNSMCRLGNHYYGANEDGIFLLDGDDDAGEDIQYFATLPTTEFGRSGLKRIPRAYMGYSNAGDMHLKIVTPDSREFVYRMNATPAGQTEALTKIGRGIVARFFTFDLYNYEGGEVELSRIEFFPLYMRRLF